LDVLDNFSTKLYDKPSGIFNVSCRNSGITVVTAGIGDKVELRDLLAIAGNMKGLGSFSFNDLKNFSAAAATSLLRTCGLSGKGKAGNSINKISKSFLSVPHAFSH